jgi:predicted ester cyclase
MRTAGGYPKVMDATGIAAMMTEFLTAFPDLRYTFDQFIVQDDYVVERYTAVGTQQGQFGDLPPSGRMATWRNQYLSHQVRTNRGGLVGGRCRKSKAAAHGRSPR